MKARSLGSGYLNERMSIVAERQGGGVMGRSQRQIIEALIYYYHDVAPRNRFQRKVLEARKVFDETYYSPENRTLAMKRLYKRTYDRITKSRELNRG